MSDVRSDGPAVEALAEEFLGRLRNGERPTVEEYVARHPDLADEIRAFFPALGLVEDFKPASCDLTGSFAGARAGGFTLLDRLDGYRILREVGRGGMGIVYEAEQESLGRRVALKVMAASPPLNPDRLQRFDREARAAAKLHHTNIVPVFGVGSHEGTPYYAMQFIRGAGLDQVLAELIRLRRKGTGAGSADHGRAREGDDPATDVARSLMTGEFRREEPGTTADDEVPPLAEAGEPSTSSVTAFSSLGKNPETSRRYAEGVARIGEEVAEALTYAHAQHILHRDIKPSNLLLDAQGKVWVADFGLAKVVGGTDSTRTGDLLGTIRYMAPERFLGRCDARADVYALGLTLYELLALRPAFAEADHQALVRQIAGDGPPRLGSFHPAVPRDLETIVHKAIEKDPAHRYQSAGEFAADLRRFLEDRPIAARRLSPLGATYRWCRRNRAVSSLLLTIQGLLAVGLVGALLVAGEFGRKAKAETVLRQKADDRAEAERKAREQVEKALAEKQAVLDFVAGLLAQISPDNGQAASTTAELLANASKDLDGRFADQPLVEARLRYILGHSYMVRGQSTEADPHLKRCVELRRKQLGDEHPETLLALKDLAWSISFEGNIEPGEKMLRDVLAIERRTLGPEHRLTIDTVYSLANILHSFGRTREAAEMAGPFVEISERVRGADAVTLGLEFLVAWELKRRGDFGKAREIFRRAYDSSNRSAGAQNYFTISMKSGMADLDLHAGDLEQAERGLGEVLAAMSPRMPPDHLEILRLAGMQIGAARRRGDYAGAAANLREALDVRLKGYPQEHPFVRIGNLTLAKDKGEIEKARTILLLLLDELTRLDPKYRTFGLGLTKLELIEILAWRGDTEEALKIAGPILDAVQGFFSERDHDFSIVRDMQARILATAPVDQPGLRDVPRALELAGADVKAFPNDGQFQTTLGIAHYQAGHFDEALAALAEGARLDKDFRVAPRGFYVAMARWGKGDQDKARDAFDEAAAWMDKNRPGHPELTRPRAEAARLLDLKDSGLLK